MRDLNKAVGQEPVGGTVSVPVSVNNFEFGDQDGVNGPAVSRASEVLV